MGNVSLKVLEKSLNFLFKNGYEPCPAHCPIPNNYSLYSAAKGHSTTTRYRQLRRLRISLHCMRPAHCPIPNHYSLYWWFGVCDAGSAFFLKKRA